MYPEKLKMSYGREFTSFTAPLYNETTSAKQMVNEGGSLWWDNVRPKQKESEPNSF
jgi:hypothetical protein